MQQAGVNSQFGLENHGLKNYKTAFWNLGPAELIEEAVKRKEGVLSTNGAFVVETGYHTGRAPKDKYFVKRDQEDKIVFWNSENKHISPEDFEKLHQKMQTYFQNRDLFIQDLIVGAHPEHHLPIRVISELAWANLLSHHLFIPLDKKQLESHIPEFTILHAPKLQADPEYDNTVSSTFVVIDLTKKVVLIGNTGYGGEIKKSIFTIMNYLQPILGNMSMHCSANVGADNESALFFGLSGTGKTTLSSDASRCLVGDDEHGWTDSGVFNYEGGCYAKTVNLDPKYEPVIFDATQRFGTVLENVILSDERLPDFFNTSLTENTRAAYPIQYVENHVEDGYAGHPKNVFFLSADAFGVLPPISKLSVDQAIYYFLSGYTAKLAGTEVGLGKEPQATFSMCFGSPFMPLEPRVYADLLAKRIEKHSVNVWLINTGWTGGPYGIGERFKLTYTRAMVNAALGHKFDDVHFVQEDFFGLWIPESCPEVPSEVLNPIRTWKNSDNYRKQADDLIKRFRNNFEKFKPIVSRSIYEAGPHLN